MGFGSFTSICAQSPLPLCFLLGPPTKFTSLHNPLLLSTCAARSIDVGNTIIFQAATDFAHMAALFMTAIMIFHVRSKFTAVGRKEVLTVFYTYTLLTIISLVLDSGVLASSSQGAFAYFVAVQSGLASALCVSLLVNGFVGFQLYEDGTALSVWLLRGSAVLMFIVSFMVSLLTFKGWAGLGPENTTGLFVVLYVVNAVCLAVYLALQIILVVNTLQDRWPLWDLAAAVFFFAVGQVVLYTMGRMICEAVNHYLDGLFFATVCNLLAIMMVYKYWDSITKEDLEFSVGTKQGNWEIQKEPFLDTTSELNHRTSFYGGAPTGRDSLYDANSLDYNPRPVSHGYTTNSPAGGGYATTTTSRPTYSSHGRSTSSHGRSGGGGDASYGNLLLEGRQSYGDLNRRSMPVQVGVEGYGESEERQGMITAASQQGQRSDVEYKRQSQSQGRDRERRRESQGRREREREREYAY